MLGKEEVIKGWVTDLPVSNSTVGSWISIQQYMIPCVPPQRIKKKKINNVFINADLHSFVLFV